MDEIRALNDTAGASIPAVLQPTFQIFVPLLIKNKASIQAISPTTESYGSHPRQKLDIYPAPQDAKDTPILVFFYGGGLVRGDKRLPQMPEQLVYHNLGTFFASRGITTIIPDYRRVNSDFGGEDAVFPSGGEDVSLVLKWLEKFGANGKRDVFIMGNSAGGVHISTFMLEPRFLEQRNSLVSGKRGTIWKGAIELGVPFHFNSAQASRSDMLKNYYGSEQDVKERSPYGLFEAVVKTGKSSEETGVPKVLILVGEFDPVDEISKPTEDFIALREKTWGKGVDFRTLAGHNHISPPVALMSGDKKAEEWGEDVAKWIKGSSS
jgi:acetyl esterase/lipase